MVIEKGMQFHSWTVLDPTPITEGKTEKVLCQCKCGTERYVSIHSLRFNISTSCGCIAFQKQIRETAKQLKGKRFGFLKVVGPSTKKDHSGAYCLECICECGNTCYYSPFALRSRKRITCGCRMSKPCGAKDLTKQQFTYLTALYYTGSTNAHNDRLWRCRCKCGNEVDVAASRLISGETKSCGCLKDEHAAKLTSYKKFVDGTSINALASQKLYSNNTSGAKGVYRVKGKFKAKLVLQGKQYSLGTYDTFEEAAAARAEVDEQIDTVLLPAYKRWKERATTDPEWAKQNPFRIRVLREADHSLRVVCTAS